jgi:energy-coupling factor transporter ATP-binding protein EcfA2
LKDGAVSERSFLSEITIKNLGVIESATLEFEPGLTVLTGETGAGKTMVLTALNLILGGKSDSALVRTGQERLIASGRFSVTKEIANSASEKGADLDGDELILTRNVNSDGKSKAIAGGISIPAGNNNNLKMPGKNRTFTFNLFQNWYYNFNSMFNKVKTAVIIEMENLYSGSDVKDTMDLYEYSSKFGFPIKEYESIYKKMHSIGIAHGDMHGYIIMFQIKKNNSIRLVVIDFGRSLL